MTFLGLFSALIDSSGISTCLDDQRREPGRQWRLAKRARRIRLAAMTIVKAKMPARPT